MSATAAATAGEAAGVKGVERVGGVRMRCRPDGRPELWEQLPFEYAWASASGAAVGMGASEAGATHGTSPEGATAHHPNGWAEPVPHCGGARLEDTFAPLGPRPAAGQRSRPMSRSLWRAMQWLCVAGVVAWMTFQLGVLFGRSQVSSRPTALVHKSAVLIETVLAHPELDRQSLQQRVTEPMRAVIERYARQGYTVVEAAPDATGGYTVLAVPPGSIDFTGELSEVVRMALADVPTAGSVPSPIGGTTMSGSPVRVSPELVTPVATPHSEQHGKAP